MRSCARDCVLLAQRPVIDGSARAGRNRAPPHSISAPHRSAAPRHPLVFLRYCAASDETAPNASPPRRCIARVHTNLGMSASLMARVVGAGGGRLQDVRTAEQLDVAQAGRAAPTRASSRRPRGRAADAQWLSGTKSDPRTLGAPTWTGPVPKAWHAPRPRGCSGWAGLGPVNLTSIQGHRSIIC